MIPFFYFCICLLYTSYEHLLLTDELVETIRQRLKYPLNESLLITLADHISFAIQRSEEGIRFSNPLMTSIREFYPEEYHLGVEMCIRDRYRNDKKERWHIQR